jgi:hypothetical protein
VALTGQIRELKESLLASAGGGGTVVLPDSTGTTAVVGKLDEVKDALGYNRSTFQALREDQAANAEALKDIRKALTDLASQQATEASESHAALAALAGNDADTQGRIDAMKVRIAGSVDAFKEAATAWQAANQSDLDAILAAVQALPAAINAVPRPDLFEMRVRSGQQTMYNTGLQVLAVAGNLRISITNPSGSGRLVWFDKIIIAHSGTAAVTGDMRFGPGLTGTPATALATLVGKNMRPGINPDATLSIRSDFNASTALAGGQGAPAAFVIGPATRSTLNENVMAVPPGAEMGINLKFAGTANAVLQLIVHTEPA